MNRRSFLALAAVAVPLLAGAAQARQIDVEAILNDPDAPVGGNPKGDVTIVAFLDYNCPFCKKSIPTSNASCARTAISASSTKTGRS